MKNCVFYMRYSSHKQNEQSIEGQREYCEKFARENGYSVINEYIDRATTGTTDNREQFQKMIEDSRKKQFQYVVVYQLDRFARNRYDSANYKAKLKKNNVRVLSARENITDDASGIILEAVLEGMAEYGSKELSQKVVRGMKLTAQKGYSIGGIIPLGYKTEPLQVGVNEKGVPIIKYEYKVDEQGAKAVNKIFEMYAGGKTIQEIINNLNAKSIKTALGNEFQKNSLRCILTNKKYIGINWWNDVEVEGGIPQIVNEELFEKVQQKMAVNKKAPARARAIEEYLLTTKLFCGICKDMLTGISGTSKTGKKHCYYGCNYAKKKDSTCNKFNITKTDLEGGIAWVLKNEVLTDENIEIIIARVVAACEKELNDNTELKFLEKQLSANERKTANFMQSLSECDLAEVRKSIFAELNKLSQEKAELEKLIAIEKNKGYPMLAPHKIRFFLKTLQKCDINQFKNQKALITALVNKVFVYNDRRIMIICNCGEKPLIFDIALQLKEDIENGSNYLLDNSALCYNSKELGSSSNSVSGSPKCTCKGATQLKSDFCKFFKFTKRLVGCVPR
jgi:DNA invertase Pin-like site-specific DNA recombinase